MLEDNQLCFYRDNGYVVLKKAINPKYFKDLFATAVNLFKSYSDGLVKISGDFISWEDENFHKAIIELRNKKPERFTAVYQAIQKSCSIANLNAHKDILECVAKLLKDSPANLSHTVAVLRMDVPNDTKNAFGFHQDSAYFDYPEYVKNINGENNITCWVPMISVNAHRGVVKLCAKSHTKGFYHNHLKLPVENPIPDEIVKKHEIINVELDPGDIVFFHGAMVHASGKNASSLVRFTFVTRYYRMLKEDFYLHPEAGEKIKGFNGPYK